MGVSRMCNAFLTELFEIERSTHLRTMASTAQLFARGEVSRESIDSMLRAAHSLKGAARLVSDKIVEETCHTIESTIKEIDDSNPIHPDTIQRITSAIEKMGGKVLLATATATAELKPSAECSTLHITVRMISELIQLSSELAVVTRRVDQALQTTHSKAARRQEIESTVLEDAQRCSLLATQLQKASYRMRLAPINEITASLATLCNSFSVQTSKSVHVSTVNGGTLIDRDLLAKIEPCLIQLLKNAIDHGIEPAHERESLGKRASGQIHVIAKQFGTVVEVEFRDDGRGIDVERARSVVAQRGLHPVASCHELSDEEVLAFLFLPGFSTRETLTELSGRGIGLDIVKETLSAMGGDVWITNRPGYGTSFHLRIPSQIASFRALLFDCGETTVGLPLAFVDRILKLDSQPELLAGRPIVVVENTIIHLVAGSSTLRLNEPVNPLRGSETIIIVNNGTQRVGLICDAVRGEEEVVVHKLDERFSREPRILGTSLCSGSRLATILDAESLLGEQSPLAAHLTESADSDNSALPTYSVLIVDDSMTVRELERQLLLQAGFQCEVACDGLDGAEIAHSGKFDLIVTDIDMPRMNGFELVEKLRSSAKHRNTPILVVSYKDRDVDRQMALQTGANAYLSKGSFKDDTFVTMVKSLLNGGQS